MRYNNKLIYGLVILFLMVTVLSTVFPSLLTIIFLCATLAVAAVSMVGGFKAGIGFYTIASIILFLLPLRQLLGNDEFYFRFFGFTLATSFLSILSHRLRFTEQARNEELLLMSAIVESSDDAIIGKNLKGIINSWNKGAETLFGYTPEEVIGKSIKMLFTHENYPEEDTILSKLKNSESISHYETTRVKKDGTVFPVSVTVSPIKNSDGIVVGGSNITRDITIRKQYEENLAKSQERYKTFVENSEEAIFLIEYENPVDIRLPVDEQINIIQTSGRITEANVKMAQLYGFKKVSDVIGKEISSFIPPTETGKDILKKWIANNYSITNYESKSIDNQGHTRFGSSSFKGIIEGGKITRAWAVQRETTEQKLREQELNNSQERYKTFIENNEFAIWRNEFRQPVSISLSYDEQADKFFKEAYVAEANKATLQYFDKDSIEDIIGKPIETVGTRTAGDDRFIRMFLEKGYNIKDYESSQTINGVRRHYSTSMVGILDSGYWIRTWIIRRDITEQKENLIEKERLLAQTSEAKAALEIASLEKDRFLANLSHELRTPLVSVLGYSSMLLEVAVDKEQTQKMLTTINKNAKLQLQLIEDLLDISRIISGNIELKKEYFSVNEVASDAIETFKQQADNKGLKITAHLSECYFYADRKRIMQVMLNLLSNAIKFTEKGEVQLCITCSDRFVTIKVKDTGMGIDSKDFSKLFKPFKQLDSSATRSKQGLGLGLSIIKTIADLHKGKINVQSKVGEGSEFTVYFPRAAGIEGQNKEGSIKSITFKDIKILIVEDDADSAGFIKYLYEQKGAEVDWASSAKEGREKLTNKTYNLYIFDLSMPEENGISLIKSLREKKDTTKAVALTAFADTYYEKLALDSGFNKFLQKPSSLSDLLSVRNLLDP